MPLGILLCRFVPNSRPCCSIGQHLRPRPSGPFLSWLFVAPEVAAIPPPVGRSVAAPAILSILWAVMKNCEVNSLAAGLFSSARRHGFGAQNGRAKACRGQIQITQLVPGAFKNRRRAPATPSALIIFFVAVDVDAAGTAAIQKTPLRFKKTRSDSQKARPFTHGWRVWIPHQALCMRALLIFSSPPPTFPPTRHPSPHGWRWRFR